ncbi:hypothetical protein NQU59_12815 [Acinetobacter colistiniresistens]|uniref:hypothetical protein n=1 Tax=Acinetobacter colistiniresistens TaxID=280145 RepID=UPI00211CA277|nr:hypothetical protein [Acinetobacter colistiniresistens]UUM26575.1 hypothetical protein NQU59_12815 [Acinetobacter colistiniresistens]
MNIIFRDRQEFIQAAFDEVARIVSEHGNACLEACVPAIIDAYLDTYKKSNAEILEFLGGEC